MSGQTHINRELPCLVSAYICECACVVWFAFANNGLFLFILFLDSISTDRVARPKKRKTCRELWKAPRTRSRGWGAKGVVFDGHFFIRSFRCRQVRWVCNVAVRSCQKRKCWPLVMHFGYIEYSIVQEKKNAEWKTVINFISKSRWAEGRCRRLSG